MSLYLLLLIGSFIIPFILSFDKKLQFYRKWKIVIPAIIFIAITYLSVDIYFTEIRIWGFNPNYHSKISFWKLPLEEWLFFIVIPYSSLFIHYSFFYYFPTKNLSDRFTTYLTVALMVLFGLLLFFNLVKSYTSYISGLILVALILGLINKKRILNYYYISFLIITIPFLIVNGILTGSFIKEPIVWYNSKEIIGVRIFTIPIEDFVYAFTLIFFNLIIIEAFSKKKQNTVIRPK